MSRSQLTQLTMPMNKTIEIYEAMSEVKSSLTPISEYEWLQWHAWPYAQIANEIDPGTESVCDIGAGCGLLGIYLVYHGVCNHAVLYDGRTLQLEYARALAEKLGILDQITIANEWYVPGVIKNQTLVAARFCSLLAFEKFYQHNKLVTLGRTADCEPIFVRRSTLDWNVKVVTREDGFQMEVMTHDHRDL